VNAPPPASSWASASGSSGGPDGLRFHRGPDARSLKLAAKTAAAIADGPSRPAPEGFRVTEKLPERYPVKLRVEDVRPDQKLRS